MRTTTVVIGAGHGGLAMSRCLSDRSIDHVVLERSEVANSWRTERWDSLRLLTPNWQCRLPGYAYDGRRPGRVHDDAGGRRVHHRLREGHRRAGAHRHDGHVGASHRRRVPRHDRSRRVGVPDRRARDGRVQRAARARLRRGGPRVGDDAHARWSTATPTSSPRAGCWSSARRRPGCRSRTRSRARVAPSRWPWASTCAGPRAYRGRDIQWWMEAAGVLDERYDEVDDIVRARRVPSMQLAGSPERATFDLNALTGIGVKLVGRLAGIRDGHAQFSGSLRNKCNLADLKLGRLLDTIDEWATATGLDEADTAAPPVRTDRGARAARRSASTWPVGRSRRSSGRPATAPTTPGSTCRSSTAREWSATTVASSSRPGCI